MKTFAEVLRGMRPDLLAQWLSRAGDFFRARGLALPASGDDRGGAGIDCEALGAILSDPDAGLPWEVQESLHIFRELATPAGMEAIWTEARKEGRTLGLDEWATPLDVVARAWLLDARWVGEISRRLELARLRSFQYYSTDSDPVPVFSGPSPEQMAALEERLNRFYVAWRRGPGVKVMAGREGNKWHFLVRHGAACRREGVMENARPATLLFRPLCYDLLIYNAARGEMAINCCGERERKVLLRHFGACLFGRSNFFPVASRYSLAPLARHGRDCLACGDVPAIERVSLTGVEFLFAGEPWRYEARRAEDIFELIEQNHLKWPEKTEDIRRATFQVKFRRSRRPRSLTIVPCNKVIYGREEDSALLEPWLRKREFVPGQRSLAE